MDDAKQGAERTRSIPMVSWIPVSNASFSLVPTPSVPATRYESPVQQTYRFDQNPNPSKIFTEQRHILVTFNPAEGFCSNINRHVYNWKGNKMIAYFHRFNQHICTYRIIEACNPYLSNKS